MKHVNVQPYCRLHSRVELMGHGGLGDRSTRHDCETFGHDPTHLVCVVYIDLGFGPSLVINSVLLVNMLNIVGWT
jgi:hypothetical protein